VAFLHRESTIHLLGVRLISAQCNIDYRRSMIRENGGCMVPKKIAVIALICSVLGLIAWGRYEPLQLAGVGPSPQKNVR
jgi:hypothetical protein